MTESCILKSNKNGLTLILDGQLAFEQLVMDICAKFAEAKHFFGKTELVLSVQGRRLSGQELAVIVEAIELNSDIHITLIEEHDELVDARMADRIGRFYFDEFYQNAKIVPGTVAKDDEVVSEGSILVLGDVKKGGRVKAYGNVIVVGNVRGSVQAGADGEKSCYIVANAFDTKELAIADTSGEVKTASGGLFNRRAPKEPVAVVLWEGSLLTEPLSNGILKQLVK